MSISLKYNEINCILVKIKKILEKKNFKIKDIKEKIIINRLLQEILMDLYSLDYYKYSSDDKCLETKNFKLNFNKNQIILKKKYFVIQIFKFAYNFLKVTSTLVLNFYKISFKDKKITIFYNLSSKDNFSEENFYNFCKKGPIKIIKNEEQLTIINSQTISKKYKDKFIFSKNIFEIIIGCVTLQNKLKIFINLFLILFFFFKKIFSNPLALILGKELIQTEIIKVLNSQKNLTDIYFTVSNDQYQEIWFNGLENQKFISHMIFYSNNYSSFPRIEKIEDIDENNIIRVPHLKFIKANKFWVWTEGFSDMLQREGINKDKINVVGPILMYLESGVKRVDDGIYNIIIFDSFPFISTGNFGELNTYNNFYNMKKFIDDTITIIKEIELRLEIKIRIYLKTKKTLEINDKRIKNRDFRYLNYLNSITDQINIINKDVNLFNLIRSSNLTITFPFLSPAYIGAYLGRKTIFYDPVSKLKEVFEKNNQIEFISDKDILKNNIFNHFNKLNETKKK